ncbi:cyclin-like protein [Pseudomassariella vexata]|uniref:Cyclin-like protein n=1 Tax=Pseudomassariella vexata TaxID=1141098 RepID=A0A1Y2EIC4_9PEZI|nr:cyclin-like protein [Pseudomassariella vexata]ORY71054.1 cyclin-like protein [Pseudomassariella vexata]
MATEDARYRQSSQFRLWSFAPSHLASLRSESNMLAKTAISARLQSSNPPVCPIPDFLTPAEEASLLTYYTNELLRAAEFCELPTEIRATSAIFLRRFYVTNSIMTYPPTELLKTCLFFGSKADGFYIRLNKFAEKFPNTTGEEVIAAEYILCQGIRFAFDVRHPFRALEGAIMELRRLESFENDRIDRAHGNARNILKYSPLVTDAYFHYTPSQIMFAALSLADEDLAERLIKNAFSGAPWEVEKKVVEVVQSCREMLQCEPPEKMNDQEVRKAMKPLIKKLKKCRDPDRVDLVALQKARKEQAGQKPKKPKSGLQDDEAVFGGALVDEREAKRRKMAEAANDPFGPALG